MSRKRINVPLNRVEGDLEIYVEVQDNVVVDAWSSGTMYRGIEGILVGRGPLDGLVITPRICGICTTSHLTAAARALDAIAGVIPPPDAVRIRNLAQMTEHIQSDIRHGVLMFAADFANPAYKGTPLFAEAVRLYEPFRGEMVIETIRETKKILEIIAIFGGQWPHSSYMVPGGIVSLPNSGDLQQCMLLLNRYRSWYERRILGCSMERWFQIQSRSQLNTWLDECESHRNSHIGFFLRFARDAGLDCIGRGCGAFVSFGALDLPQGTKVRSSTNDAFLIPAGFSRGTQKLAFDHQNVAEHVRYSWYVDYEGGRHPFKGETRPYATGKESDKYSWSKAPRYDGHPAETGPLAEMILAGNPLFTDLVDNGGPSVFVRELARLIRPTMLMPAMETWLAEMSGDGNYYTSPGEITEGEGFGLTQASRGALGHWVKIEAGKIQRYQIITPTAWNASPRDSNNYRGPIEEALIGTPVKDESNTIELGHVVRSFDPCLVCTVHAVCHGENIGRITAGMAL